MDMRRTSWYLPERPKMEHIQRLESIELIDERFFDVYSISKHEANKGEDKKQTQEKDLVISREVM